MAASLAGATLRPAGAQDMRPILDLGFGGNSLGHISAQASFGAFMERHYVASTLRGSSEFRLFADKLPDNSMGEVNITAGWFFHRTFAYASIGAGLSALSFEERTDAGRENPDCTGMFCADSIFETRTTYTVGLPIEAVAVLKAWVVGLGWRAYANLNPHDSFIGGGPILFLGGGEGRRKRRES